MPCPGPDHDVGQGRVERLAEPGAAEDVLGSDRSGTTVWTAFCSGSKTVSSASICSIGSAILSRTGCSFALPLIRARFRQSWRERLTPSTHGFGVVDGSTPYHATEIRAAAVEEGAVYEVKNADVICGNIQTAKASVGCTPVVTGLRRHLPDIQHPARPQLRMAQPPLPALRRPLRSLRRPMRTLRRGRMPEMRSRLPRLRRTAPRHGLRLALRPTAGTELCQAPLSHRGWWRGACLGPAVLWRGKRRPRVGGLLGWLRITL